MSDVETITVTRRWLESLLEYALKVEEDIKKHKFNEHSDAKLIHSASSLSGYAKSAKYILSTPNETRTTN